MMTLDGWAVYDGRSQRHGGQMVDTDPDTADRWEAAGLIERANDAKTTAKQTPARMGT